MRNTTSSYFPSQIGTWTARIPLGSFKDFSWASNFNGNSRFQFADPLTIQLDGGCFISCRTKSDIESRHFWKMWFFWNTKTGKNVHIKNRNIDLGANGQRGKNQVARQLKFAVENYKSMQAARWFLSRSIHLPTRTALHSSWLCPPPFIVFSLGCLFIALLSPILLFLFSRIPTTGGLPQNDPFPLDPLDTDYRYLINIQGTCKSTAPSITQLRRGYLMPFDSHH